MGPLNLGSLFLHRCVQLLFVILEINNPCGSGSFRMAAVLHILGKRLLLFWINSQLSWRRCIRSVPFTFSAAAAKLLQSCPTLCDPIDSSLPGSSVPGILQARTLEWVAIAFSEIYWFTLYQVFYFTDLLITYFPILPHFVLWSFGLIIWSLITCNIYFLGSKRLLLQSDYLCCFLTLFCFCSWFSYFFMWNCIILHLKTFFFLVFAYLALVLGKYDLKCN